MSQCVHTIGSKHALPISPNVLDRQFNPRRPNQAWLADITYVRTRSCWLHLAVVLDLFAVSDGTDAPLGSSGYLTLPLWHVDAATDGASIPLLTAGAHEPSRAKGGSERRCSWAGVSRGKSCVSAIT